MSKLLPYHDVFDFYRGLSPDEQYLLQTVVAKRFHPCALEKLWAKLLQLCADNPATTIHTWKQWIQTTTEGILEALRTYLVVDDDAGTLFEQGRRLQGKKIVAVVAHATKCFDVLRSLYRQDFQRLELSPISLDKCWGHVQHLTQNRDVHEWLESFAYFGAADALPPIFECNSLFAFDDPTVLLTVRNTVIDRDAVKEHDVGGAEWHLGYQFRSEQGAWSEEYIVNGFRRDGQHTYLIHGYDEGDEGLRHAVGDWCQGVFYLIVLFGRNLKNPSEGWYGEGSNAPVRVPVLTYEKAPGAP